MAPPPSPPPLMVVHQIGALALLVVGSVAIAVGPLWLLHYCYRRKRRRLRTALQLQQQQQQQQQTGNKQQQQQTSNTTMATAAKTSNFAKLSQSNTTNHHPSANTDTDTEQTELGAAEDSRTKTNKSTKVSRHSIITGWFQQNPSNYHPPSTKESRWATASSSSLESSSVRRRALSTNVAAAANNGGGDHNRIKTASASVSTTAASSIRQSSSEALASTMAIPSVVLELVRSLDGGLLLAALFLILLPQLRTTFDQFMGAHVARSATLTTTYPTSLRWLNESDTTLNNNNNHNHSDSFARNTNSTNPPTPTILARIIQDSQQHQYQHRILNSHHQRGSKQSAHLSQSYQSPVPLVELILCLAFFALHFVEEFAQLCLRYRKYFWACNASLVYSSSTGTCESFTSLDYRLNKTKRYLIDCSRKTSSSVASASSASASMTGTTASRTTTVVNNNLVVVVDRNLTGRDMIMEETDGSSDPPSRPLQKTSNLLKQFIVTEPIAAAGSSREQTEEDINGGGGGGGVGQSALYQTIKHSTSNNVKQNPTTITTENPNLEEEEEEEEEEHDSICDNHNLQDSLQLYQPLPSASAAHPSSHNPQFPINTTNPTNPTTILDHPYHDGQQPPSLVSTNSTSSYLPSYYWTAPNHHGHGDPHSLPYCPVHHHHHHHQTGDPQSHKSHNPHHCCPCHHHYQQIAHHHQQQQQQHQYLHYYNNHNNQNSHYNPQFHQNHAHSNLNRCESLSDASSTTSSSNSSSSSNASSNSSSSSSAIFTKIFLPYTTLATSTPALYLCEGLLLAIQPTPSMLWLMLTVVLVHKLVTGLLVAFELHERTTGRQRHLPPSTGFLFVALPAIGYVAVLLLNGYFHLRDRDRKQAVAAAASTISTSSSLPSPSAAAASPSAATIDVVSGVPLMTVDTVVGGVHQSDAAGPLSDPSALIGGLSAAAATAAAEHSDWPPLELLAIRVVLIAVATATLLHLVLLIIQRNLVQLQPQFHWQRPPPPPSLINQSYGGNQQPQPLHQQQQQQNQQATPTSSSSSSSSSQSSSAMSKHQLIPTTTTTTTNSQSQTTAASAQQQPSSSSSSSPPSSECTKPPLDHHHHHSHCCQPPLPPPPLFAPHHCAYMGGPPPPLYHLGGNSFPPAASSPSSLPPPLVDPELVTNPPRYGVLHHFTMYTGFTLVLMAIALLNIRQSQTT